MLPAGRGPAEKSKNTKPKGLEVESERNRENREAREIGSGVKEEILEHSRETPTWILDWQKWSLLVQTTNC